MNKIHNAFENKKAFIGFLTAGDPTFEDSFNNIMAMVKGGADLIEIGIPFSDPIAEGPVIQDANIVKMYHLHQVIDRAAYHEQHPKQYAHDHHPVGEAVVLTGVMSANDEHQQR